MDTKILDRYDRAVPRYTSYPTAPHFGAEVTPARYRDWLGELSGGETASLYLHVPFCRRLCWFCGCTMTVINSQRPVASYLESLRREIGLVAEALPARLGVRHVHWGGGSPNTLTPEDWLEMMALLRGLFDIAPDAEVAVELDPRTTSRDYVRALAAAGVNRASIGIQDNHPEVQAAINRIQPPEVTARVVRWLREAGIDGINADLVYGLPHQDEARFAATVRDTIALKPDRIALFGYAHVPWMKPHQNLINEAALPGAHARFRLARQAAEQLEEGGYVRIGLDHFALPEDPMTLALEAGTLHRNFQGYTVDAADVLLGFGPSAIGRLPQGYVQNETTTPGWRKAVLEGALPVARGHALDAEDRLRGEIVERLMCEQEVDLADVCRRHGAKSDMFLGEVLTLASMRRDGLVEIFGDTIRITEAGRPFCRLAAAAFDAYLGRGEGRHSRAV